jgi:hypothetical protein
MDDPQIGGLRHGGAAADNNRHQKAYKEGHE